MTRPGRKPLRCGCRRVRIGTVRNGCGEKPCPLYRWDRCDKHRAQLVKAMAKLGFQLSKDGLAFLREQAS